MPRVFEGGKKGEELEKRDLEREVRVLLVWWRKRRREGRRSGLHWLLWLCLKKRGKKRRDEACIGL